MWHDSWLCVVWLIRMWDGSPLPVRQIVATCVTWLLSVQHMRHDSWTCVAGLIPTCSGNTMCHGNTSSVQNSCATCVAWLIHVQHMWHALLMCNMWEMTHSYAAYETWLKIWDMTQSRATNATWLSHVLYMRYGAYNICDTTHGMATWLIWDMTQHMWHAS